MRLKSFALVLLLLVSAAMLRGADRPNIIFFLADDWGWPHAGAYGDAVVQTPSFDRIAREGALFDNAYISSPSCTPSRNAIMTGQDFWRLRQAACLWSTLPDDVDTFPDLLRQAGYHTGSYRKSWGPGRITGRWKENFPTGKPYESFADFLQVRPDGDPFCFWWGSSDPHRSYKEGSGEASGMDLSKVHLFPHFPDSEVVRSDVADYYWEVQRFDREVGEALELLEKSGEADNTIVVISGDHGMPFPRGKANLYDSGARVPLAIRWPARVSSGQRFEGFVSMIDLAPTFLAAAKASIPAATTGRNLLPVLERKRDAHLRTHALMGKERHVPMQEGSDRGGYPMRGLRTKQFLYIRNFTPDRWPSGTPDWEKAFIKGCWLGDCDNGPTKSYIVDHRDDDDAHRRAYGLAFGKRPAEELYDLKNDPGQLENVAGQPAFGSALRALRDQLTAELRKLADPRVTGTPDPKAVFEDPPYYGTGPRAPGLDVPSLPPDGF